MRHLLLLSILLLTTNVFSQPSTLLNGAWNTHNSSQSTVVTAGLVNAKVFAITATPMVACPSPSPCAGISNVAFAIYVDGSTTPLKQSLMEGSTAFIEAKKIVIKQIIPDSTDPEPVMQGTWNVVQENQFVTTSYAFSDLPVSRIHLLANFITAQDFAIEFGSNSSFQPCTSGFMTVYIEDKAVLNPLTGKAAEFPMGSGFHGNGKNVAVSFTGTCPPKKGFNGYIKFLKDKPAGPAVAAP